MCFSKPKSPRIPPPPPPPEDDPKPMGNETLDNEGIRGRRRVGASRRFQIPVGQGKKNSGVGS